MMYGRLRLLIVTLFAPALWTCATVGNAQAVPPPATRDSVSHISHLIGVHNRYALSLAERGACLSAEQEYFKALWLSAHRLDAMHGGATRSEALAAARRAFDESDDFARYLPENAGADVRPQIVGHKTTVLQNSTQPIAPLAALQGYYNYASTQLIRAVDGEPLASCALSGLAQIQALLLVDKHESTAPAKAIALFQAAIAVDPTNALAANELGVLFTKYGRLEPARQAFTLSLQAEQRPATWHNLARVYDLLGKPELAMQARNQKQILLETAKSEAGRTPQIAWVDLEEFNAVAGHTIDDNDARTALVDSRSEKQPANDDAVPRSASSNEESDGEKEGGLLRKVMSLPNWRKRG